MFTITQLSYTFRPRRRPKRQRDKQEKYHHSIKALAIREKKIHIVGRPELRIDGTPVYLDVEGLPDRDSYYLIGMRIKSTKGIVQHSLWADKADTEGKIWRDFLRVLSQIENPVLIHYGSFESTFIKRMCDRYDEPEEDSAMAIALKSTINLLSFVYAQIYFPTLSNGLKEIAGYLGFRWSDENCFGVQSIAWRHLWEESRDSSVKEKLLRYNAEDCQALEKLSQTIREIGDAGTVEPTDQISETKFIRLDSDRFNKKSKWHRFTSPVSSLELINSAAQWNYQRDRVYARTGEVKQEHKKRRSQRQIVSQPEKVIIWDSPRACPCCNRSYYKKRPDKSKKLPAYALD
ncbi:MAG: TM0106 family RecB-like putative nuclease [Nitrospirae bacterium]|nr:TM0106 family RecB-like putative nuclease [Nitrospirota bacterium]